MIHIPLAKIIQGITDATGLYYGKERERGPEARCWGLVSLLMPAATSQFMGIWICRGGGVDGRAAATAAARAGTVAEGSGTAAERVPYRHGRWQIACLCLEDAVKLAASLTVSTDIVSCYCRHLAPQCQAEALCSHKYGMRANNA